jgi:hypothetical protein
MEAKKVRIVIGQRGWVWVGYYSASADEVTLSSARCIRRWGTPGEGLGALAAGPKPGTVMDPAGTVRLHPLAVVATYDCDASRWEAALGS